MSSDISRYTTAMAKKSDGVIFLQGGVITDANLNEQFYSYQHRLHTQTKDVIGRCGVPKGSNGFRITASASGTDLLIAAGHIYVDGLLCELKENQSYATQSPFPNPDLATTPISPPDGAVELKLTNGRYLVYLEAWQREISRLDDPIIQDIALRDANTADRLRTLCQVGLLKVDNDLNCADASNEWSSFIAPATGKLQVKVDQAGGSSDPCGLSVGGGYRGLENHLYRVEIHQGGNQGSAFYKWYRSSVETAITGISANGSGDTIFEVSGVGQDQFLGFIEGQWVGLVDPNTVHNRQTSDLLLVKKVDSSLNTITVNLPAGTLSLEEGQKLRRWDQVNNADVDGIPVSIAYVELEEGIQVAFTAGTYRVGDYWYVEARTLTRNVNWPVDEGTGNPIPQSPFGVDYSYCKLALVEVQGGEFRVVDDCRPIFPTLTKICAEDICYDSSNCDITKGATTVQEALDALCAQRGQGNCTLHVSPGEGWEEVFSRIGANQDAKICFEVGVYPIPNAPVKVEGKGHLTLQGAGKGTRIISQDGEAALVFVDCKSVLARDLHCEATKTHIGKGNKSPKVYMNGALTFINCPLVDVEQLSLKNGAGSRRMATCLTVYNDIEQPGEVRILNSICEVGYYQNGLSVINAKNALIQNNRIKAYKRPEPLGVIHMAVSDREYRRKVQDWLIYDIEAVAAAPVDRSAIRRKKQDFLTFRTHNILAESWTNIIAEMPEGQSAELKQVKVHVGKRFNQILSDQTVREEYPAIKKALAYIDEQDADFMSQGITVAGRVGENIRILNNDVHGALDGIHVGFSHENDPEEPYLSKNLTIKDNSVHVLLPAYIGNKGGFGIYNGNSVNTLIENNTIILQRMLEYNKKTTVTDLPADGIRAFGVYGNRVLIDKNTILPHDQVRVHSFDTAIRFNPVRSQGDFALWKISNNIAIGRNSQNSIITSGAAAGGIADGSNQK